MKKLACIYEEAREQSDFGNGRYVRNMLEHAKMNQAVRLLGKELDCITAEEITTITAEDIEELNAPETEKKRAIGFL